MLLLMLAAQVADPIAAYRDLTRADVPCDKPADAREIVVCGRREADRYRITFLAVNVRDSVPTERARLLEPKMAGCGRVGQFFADCGFVGVTVSTSGAGLQVKTRKLAD